MLQRHFHVSPLYPQQPTFDCSAISVAKGHQEKYAVQQITANRINSLVEDLCRRTRLTVRTVNMKLIMEELSVQIRGLRSKQLPARSYPALTAW